ncbi:MAG: DUF932 domain-containing protein, partial [Roseovarius sp.]
MNQLLHNLNYFKMPKKIKECSKAELISVDLPTHGDSYTVISHESVIDYVYTELANAGFGVVSETFRATADGQIAHGVHVLNYNSDPELSMMFAWTNSYNKQVRFKCGVGAYVNQAGTFMVHGDMGSWSRKHTGTADEETVETIKEQIKDAQMYYDQLKSDKDAMKEIKMNKRKQSQLLGILFAEYQILTTEQASMIRSEMIKPTHVFEDTSSLWAFYNYVTTALQASHPKTWMEDQRVLHYFISSVNNFSKPSVPQPVVEAEVDPLTTNYGQPENQLNILTEIEKTEAEEPSLELEQNEEYLENPVNLETLDEISSEDIEQTVSYTDPMGNTFEAPIVIESIEPEEEEEEFQIDEDQEWTGENASTASLEPN